MKIFVKVKPNSKEEGVIFEGEGKYRVLLKESAEKNKANKELVRILSKFFNVVQKDIIIKTGLTNREKIIEIR